MILRRAMFGVVLLGLAASVAVAAEPQEPAPPPAKTAPADEKTAAVGEKVDNPLYQHWAKFKPGSYATLRTVSEAFGRKNETVVTVTLKQVSAESVLVMKRTLVSSGDRSVPRKPVLEEHLAKITPAELKKQGPQGKLAEGDEEIEIAGKKFKTHWVRTKTELDPITVETQRWLCEDVPGRVVKVVSKAKGPIQAESAGEVVDYKAIKR